MKTLVLSLVLALGLGFLVACGSSNSSSSNINGNWTATLSNTNGTAAFQFNTGLTQNSDGTLTMSNFTFTTASQCFQGQVTTTGGLSLSGTTNGVTGGGFQILVSSSTDILSRNLLTLNGTIQNSNSISGTWVLSGAGTGCSGNGNFTMTKA